MGPNCVTAARRSFPHGSWEVPSRVTAMPGKHHLLFRTGLALCGTALARCFGPRISVGAAMASRQVRIEHDDLGGSAMTSTPSYAATLLAAGALLATTVEVRAQDLTFPDYRSLNLSALLEARFGPVSEVSSRPMALNDAGQVVGRSVGGSWATDTAFLISGGFVQTLGGLHLNTQLQRRPLNNKGDVAGFLAVEEYGLRTAAIHSGGALITLDVPATPAVSQALAISDTGMVVGSRRDGRRDLSFTLQQGQRNDFMNLAQAPIIVEVNSAGLVAGNRLFGNDFAAFLYDGSRVVDIAPPLGGRFRAAGLNDVGVLAGDMTRWVHVCDDEDGQYCYESPRYRASVFDGTDFVTVPTRDTDYAFALAINNHGLVAGNDDFGGWLWDGREIRYLEGVLARDGVRPGTTLVHDINDSGQLLVSGRIGATEGYWLLTPVPEPGSWGLMVVGLLAMGIAARQRAHEAHGWSFRVAWDRLPPTLRVTTQQG